MHIVIPQSVFSKSLDEVRNAIASRPTHPILANVKIDAVEEAQTMTLTAFDLSLAIRVDLPIQVVSGGSITVAHKLLMDIVSRLPDEDITLTVESRSIKLICGGGKYELNGLPVEEFPELPTIEAKNTTIANLSPNLLLQGLAATLFAASTDDTKRSKITGIHITVNESIEFAATDGHRLSVLNCELPEGDYADFELTIPARSLREIEKLCKTQESAIAASFDSANMIFSTGSKTVITRLLDGNYPNYRQLIPSQFERKITFERKLFLSALERIAVLAAQRNNIVKLTIDNTAQSIALSVESPDVATGREEVTAQISGEELEIAFNVKYLLDGLKSFDTNEIQLQINKPTSPAVIVPIGAAKQTYLIMPVQIR